MVGTVLFLTGFVKSVVENTDRSLHCGELKVTFSQLCEIELEFPECEGPADVCSRAGFLCEDSMVTVVEFV